MVIPQRIDLSGDWAFTYTPAMPGDHKFPHPDQYSTTMPIPSYWDNNIERLERTVEWSRSYRFNPDYRQVHYPMGAGKPADASLPYILGVGWYAKRVTIGNEYSGNPLSLCIGGASVDTHAWVNGHYLGAHQGHLYPFSFPIEAYVRYGQENLIILAVDNLRDNMASCILRGYKGRSGGVYGNVFLHASGKASIEDLYAYPDATLEHLYFGLSLRGDTQKIKVKWAIEDDLGNIKQSGTQEFAGNLLAWEAKTDGILPWSDHEPTLYSLVVAIYDGDNILDSLKQSFGLRHVAVEGDRIKVNGQRQFLRGLTEHAYFPETCTQPLDKEYYKKRLIILKKLGFNWIRFHTWAPNAQYVEACNEVGFYVQVETPNGFAFSEWTELRPC